MIDRRRVESRAHQSARGRMPGLTIVTNRCVVLNYGRKIKEGTFAEVAGDRHVQEAYLAVA